MKTITLKLSVGEWPAVLHVQRYSNNRIAIECLDPNDGEPIAVATVNLPDEHLGENEVFIKDYSENEGMLNSLMEAGIVSAPIDMVQSGFVQIPKCKLLWNILDELNP